MGWEEKKRKKYASLNLSIICARLIFSFQPDIAIAGLWLRLLVPEHNQIPVDVLKR